MGLNMKLGITAGMPGKEGLHRARAESEGRRRLGQEQEEEIMSLSQGQAS
jgi:hypothetical protein